MVVGQRVNPDKMVKEYYVKSRRAEDYKAMILKTLYHPPVINFERDKSNVLKLYHRFEGKELYREYIQNTLIGIEYLWGNKVQLVTTEFDWERIKRLKERNPNLDLTDINNLPLQKVRYVCKEKKVTKQKIN